MNWEETEILTIFCKTECKHGGQPQQRNSQKSDQRTLNSNTVTVRISNIALRGKDFFFFFFFNGTHHHLSIYTSQDGLGWA